MVVVVAFVDVLVRQSMAAVVVVVVVVSFQKVALGVASGLIDA